MKTPPFSGKTWAFFVLGALLEVFGQYAWKGGPNLGTWFILGMLMARVDILQEKRTPHHPGAHTVTPAEEEILRHALGLTRKSEPYRCHFAASPGTEEEEVCESLKQRGYMTRSDPPDPLHLIFYYVTLAGAEAVGVTKAQYENASE